MVDLSRMEYLIGKEKLEKVKNKKSVLRQIPLEVIDQIIDRLNESIELADYVIWLEEAKNLGDVE